MIERGDLEAAGLALGQEEGSWSGFHSQGTRAPHRRIKAFSAPAQPAPRGLSLRTTQIAFLTSWCPDPLCSRHPGTRPPPQPPALSPRPAQPLLASFVPHPSHLAPCSTSAAGCSRLWPRWARQGAGAFAQMLLYSSSPQHCALSTDEGPLSGPS